MKLVLLAADSLPRTIGELRRDPASAEAEAGAGAIAAALAEAIMPAAVMLERLASIPVRPPGVKIARPDYGTPRSRKDVHFAIHDRFFGVFRACGDAPELFAHAVLVGYRDVLREALDCGTTLSEALWGDLRWGLEEAIRFAYGVPPRQPRPLPPPVGTGRRDPHRRWRAGHHAFFPLIQAVVVGLNCFQSAILDDDMPVAAGSLQFATAVMRASSSAMRFAADFLPAEYAAMVRIAMAPPYLPVGLSGVMAEDHVRLIRCFHELREILPGIPAELRVFRDSFIEAVDAAYAAHSGVCARFGGEHIVSLRMSQGSSGSAVGVLAQLRKSRLKALRSA
jgi:hypothetical protein